MSRHVLHKTGITAVSQSSGVLVKQKKTHLGSCRRAPYAVARRIQIHFAVPFFVNTDSQNIDKM